MIRSRKDVVSVSRTYVVFPYKFGKQTIKPTAIVIPDDMENNAQYALALYMKQDPLAMMENIVLTAEEIETLEMQGLAVGMNTCSI